MLEVKDKGETFQPVRSQIDSYKNELKGNCDCFFNCDETPGNETKEQLFGKTPSENVGSWF